MQPSVWTENPRAWSTCSSVRACLALPSLRTAACCACPQQPDSAAAPQTGVSGCRLCGPKGHSTPCLPYEPSPLSQPCRRCAGGGCGAASRLLRVRDCSCPSLPMVSDKLGPSPVHCIDAAVVQLPLPLQHSPTHRQSQDYKSSTRVQKCFKSTTATACAGRRPAAESANSLTLQFWQKSHTNKLGGIAKSKMTTGRTHPCLRIVHYFRVCCRLTSQVQYPYMQCPLNNNIALIDGISVSICPGHQYALCNHNCVRIGGTLQFVV